MHVIVFRENVLMPITYSEMLLKIRWIDELLEEQMDREVIKQV